MADIPLTTGQPDRGAGAYQFTGHTLYDPLVAWEANIGTRPGKLVPGLATAWNADAKDNKKWTFTLRKGVKFHDGSEFNADAVIWNLDKVLADKSPQFDAKQSAQVRPRIPSIASYRKLDGYSVEIVTKNVDALFPYQLPWFLISSPTQWEKLGKDWSKVAMQPSGPAIWGWTDGVISRLTRAQVLAVKVEDYIEAARAVGNPHWRIALRHMLPNVLPPLIVQSTLAIAAAVIAEASLSFLGLGQQPPAPSWGSMLNTAKNYVDSAPWMAIWPGLSIFLLVLSFNLLGDGLRDALDPRHK